MRFRNTFLLAPALVLATALPGLADGLQAQLSARRIAQGDQVVLTLSADAASGAGQPDLSALGRDFDVLGTSSGSQTTIINGRRSDRRTWRITLAPKHQGDLVVPEITAGAVSSAPLDLQVVDAGSLPPAAQAGRPAVTLTMPEGAVYALQEVPLDLQVRLPAGTKGAEVVAPSGSGYLLEQSGEDRVTPQADGTALLERRYLLRPQTDGALELGAFSVRAEVADPNARSPFAGMGRSPFGRSPFGNSMFDDFFNGGMFAPTQVVGAASDPVTLDVLPTPGGASGWVLPATLVELHSEWQPNPPEFRVGEAVTRKVQVLALGAHGEQIPDVEMPDIPGARVYFEGAESRSVPTEKGTAALREFTWSIVPTSGGEITLPELAVDWFDTGAEAPARAVLPAETFTVEGPVTPVAKAPAPAAPAPAAAPASTSSGALTAWLAAGGAVLLAGIAAIGLLVRRIRAQRRAGSAQRAGAPAPTGKRREALTRAAAAARANDAAAMHRAALDWCRAAGMVPDNTAARFPVLARGIAQLEAALFGQADARPDLAALLSALRAADGVLRGPVTRGAALPPLYPASA